MVARRRIRHLRQLDEAFQAKFYGSRRICTAACVLELVGALFGLEIELPSSAIRCTCRDGDGLCVLYARLAGYNCSYKRCRVLAALCTCASKPIVASDRLDTSDSVDWSDCFADIR